MLEVQMRAGGSSVTTQCMGSQAVAFSPPQPRQGGQDAVQEGGPARGSGPSSAVERADRARVESFCLDLALRHGLFCDDLYAQRAVAHASADLTGKTLRFGDAIEPGRAAVYARAFAQLNVILWDLYDEAALRRHSLSLTYRDALAACVDAAWTAPFLPGEAGEQDQAVQAELDARAVAARRVLDEVSAGQGREPLGRPEDWHRRLWAATRETRALLSVDLGIGRGDTASFDRSLREHLEARRAAWTEAPRALPAGETDPASVRKDSISTLIAFGLMARAAERPRKPGRARAERASTATGGSALGAILAFGYEQATLAACLLDDLVALFDDAGSDDVHALSSRAEVLARIHLRQERAIEQLGDICRSLRYLAALRADEGHEDAALLLDAATVYADVARGYCDWILQAPSGDGPLWQSLVRSVPSSRRRVFFAGRERDKGGASVSGASASGAA